MRMSGLLFARLILVVAVFAPVLAAQEEKPLPPPDRAPHLILAHNGPHAPVRALAFSPDGDTLYVGGFDKQVRRYQRADGKWKATGSFRVPIGPGNAGAVNAIAVSPDGKWVAVAGRAPIRGENWNGADDGIDTDFRRLSPLLKRDAGVVYLFDPANPNGGKVLRGQSSEVRALAFASPAPSPILITAGIEWDSKGELRGAVHLFDVETDKVIASRDKFPPATSIPGLAAWSTGARKEDLRVVVAWDDLETTGSPLPSKLTTWDNPGTGRETVAEEPEALLISPLAVRVKDGKATELITSSVNKERTFAGLTRRELRNGVTTSTVLKDAGGKTLLVTAIAAFGVKDAGDATAVVLPAGRDAEGPRYELRLLTPKGNGSVTRGGFRSHKPVLAASADGRFVAIAGFRDNHVEVIEAAALVVNKEVVEKLAGDVPGFSKVAFLPNEKLWLGRGGDSLDEGGAILDLNAKVHSATPRADKGKLKTDSPDAPAPEILNANAKDPARVVVTVDGARRTIALPVGETVTAAAVLPAKPAWDAALGTVIAVAHIHERTQSVLLSLLDPAGKLLYRFGGPTLPVRSLAFCASRPLLAGAGDDGTVAVWSLKNLSRPLPAIEGLLITEQNGEVIVASVEAKSPADGKFKPNDVIESVAGAKGVQKPVKTGLDFVLAVRALKVGDNAQVKVKGQAAVAVKVGTSVGFRHPLFRLWVDPVAKDGKHEWVGWTAAGPYDASGEAGEGRIGWLTATGDPARPVSFAPAMQYRKLYYKRDLIRELLERGEFNISAPPPAPTRPALLSTWPATTYERDGVRVTRARLDGVEITVRDPDNVLDFDRSELQWRVIGPGGAAEWSRESFSSGRVTLDLSRHAWKRGEHRVQVKLVKVRDAGAEPAPPIDEITTGVTFIPPPPVLSVLVDGKAPKPGAELATENAEVEVSATVEAKDNPDGVAVTVSAPGGKPVGLQRAANGTYGPTKVKLQDKDATVVLVTATNVGGAMDETESHAVEVRARKLAPKMAAPPTVRLEVVSKTDFRQKADDPYVVRAPTVRVRATVESEIPIKGIEWVIGDGKPEAGKLDPKTKSEVRELELADDKPLVVQILVQPEKGPAVPAAVRIVFDELPVITVNPLQETRFLSPEVHLDGGLKLKGKRPFKVRVRVRSARTPQSNEFEPRANETATKWDVNLMLYPGENLVDYVVKYDDDRQEVWSKEAISVWYLRPPSVAWASPVDAGAGAAGDLNLAAVSADAPPTELWVNNSRVGFRSHPTPLFFIGVPVWVLQANSVSVTEGEQRLKQLAVAVRNPDGESPRVNVNVLTAPEKPVPPPVIQLTRDGGLIADKQLAPVGDPGFRFQLKIASEARLTRVEVWHRVGNEQTGEEVGGVNPQQAVAVPGGFELTAAPLLRLRPGENFVRVVATNGAKETAAHFKVSYNPPAVRVILSSIKEPGGAPISVTPGSAAELRVEKGVVDVEGRIEWDFEDEPIGRDPNLSVVFLANGVAHLPVTVQPAKGGKARKFSGRVYLNSNGVAAPNSPSTVRVKVDLRSGGRPVPIPRQSLSGEPVTDAVTVVTKEPIRRQRFHVVMLGVEVPDSQRRVLVHNLVRGLGGELPADNPNFTEGRFVLKGYEFAYVYSPRLGYTKSGDLNALLNAVRADIMERSKRVNDEWVNDVIMLYYHGADWVDGGRWMCHTAATLGGAAGKNLADYAIRMDDLPQVPGLLLAMTNVANSESFATDLLTELTYFRFAWKQAGGRMGLFQSVEDAFRDQATVEKIWGRLAELLNRPNQPQPNLNRFISEVVKERAVSSQKP